MISKRNFLAVIAFAATMSINTHANADVFAIDYHSAGVWNAYDSENESYAMKFRSDQGKDGFWLVVTDGDNPKGDGSSHAILYGDLENNRITAYTYEGTNSANSYRTGTLLGTYDNVFSSGGTHARYGYELTQFSLDVSQINNAIGGDFDGVAIGPQAGIWFHQSEGSDFSYGADGSITNYAFDNQMWLDTGNDATRHVGTVDCSTGQSARPNYLNSCDSTQVSGGLVNNFSGGSNQGTTVGGTSTGGGSVPAPGGLALLLVGIAALGRKLHRAKA